MTERRTTEPLETRLARLARAYTDPATTRPVDVVAIARDAMTARPATGWSLRRPAAGLPGWRIPDPRWAVAIVAVTLIGVVGAALLGRPSDSVVGPRPTAATLWTASPVVLTGGPIPDVLRHAWQRPQPITPGLDRWGSGVLDLRSESLGYGPVPGSAASKSAVAAATLDALVVTATVETVECGLGAVGTYHWSVEGSGTVLTLTAIGADGCPAREKSLGGDWVRSDLPPGDDGSSVLRAGTHLTLAFDPFDRPGASGQLSYTVPEGWRLLEDRPAVVTLHRPSAGSGSLASADAFLFVLAQPRLAADFAHGASCGPFGMAPGVGLGVHDLVEAITARPGVVSAPPAAVTIGGFEGQLLDLTLAPDRATGCLAPDGRIAAVPILVGASPEGGPSVGLGPDHPVRLILVDLTGGRTIVIAIGSAAPSDPSSFLRQVAEVMPIIDSFEFHLPAS